ARGRPWSRNATSVGCSRRASSAGSSRRHERVTRRRSARTAPAQASPAMEKNSRKSGPLSESGLMSPPGVLIAMSNGGAFIASPRRRDVKLVVRGQAPPRSAKGRGAGLLGRRRGRACWGGGERGHGGAWRAHPRGVLGHVL